VIEGACDIGPRCEIGPGAHLRASRLAADCRVWHSVVEESEAGERCEVGPFAHLRPGSRLGQDVAVGNFAEVKNAILGDGTKQHHHSYIGDAALGPGVNVGAGAITVNYDGRRKHRTTVGAGAFVGCNANLVAPVEVGAGAYVAAGSTVTKPVPADALAIGRARQEVREGWAARRRAVQAAADLRGE
jgi:bifunctional UDP-N-acetylglucosamine pyrophosphorylase/glucosamine-1-phosphate N-acetyltransferase